MMYVIQAVTFLAAIWASIYYEWSPNGYANGLVALLITLFVTAVVIEISLLPSRLARLYQRIFGLKDEPTSQVPRLARRLGHRHNTLEDRSRLRIGKDLR